MTKKDVTLESRIKPEDFYRELTNPKTHDPNYFCYIVHGLNPAAKTGLLSFTIEKGGYDFKQEIDLLSEPERITEKLLISSSIINQDHVATWGDTFFILSVPWANFVSMSPRDSGTNVTNPSGVLEYARSPYTIPSRFIAETRHCRGDSSYNEVVMTGNKGGNLVEIIGVGIKYTDVGETRLREPREAERMREIADTRHIPVIQIIKQSKIEDSGAEVNYGDIASGVRPVRSIYVNYGGYRYCFVGDWNKTELKEVFKSDRNFYGGYNSVSQSEYSTIRSIIIRGLSTEIDLQFLKQIDERFGLNLPNKQIVFT